MKNPTTKKRKLMYVITKGNWGGAQKYVFTLANYYKDKFDVVVLLGEGDYLKNRLEKTDIEVIQIDNLKKRINLKNDIRAFFQIRKIIQKENPDIIHLNSSKAGFIGAIATKVFYILHPKPYTLIFTAHGWAFNDKTFPWQKLIFKTIQWITVLMANTTITVSKKTKEDMSNWPLVSKKMTIIYNGVNLIDFLSKDGARKQLFPNTETGFLIGTISELHKNKGLDILIKSIASLIKKDEQKISLAIIGDGEEKKSLQRLSKEEGVEKNVFFLGFVENAETFLKALDIFTLTSRTEGFPLVLLEVGLANIPVIASKVGGIPEIINEKTGIIVKKEDVELLRQELKHLINQPQKRDELALNLKKLVEEKFDISKLAEETLLVYNS